MEGMVNGERRRGIAKKRRINKSPIMKIEIMIDRPTDQPTGRVS